MDNINRLLRSTASVAVLAAGLGLVQSARAQTSYPMVISIHPVGFQRGVTTEATLTGRQNLQGAYAVLFEAKGLSAEIVPPADPKKATDTLQLKVTATAEAPLGPVEFRVVTPRGISSVGQIVLGTEPAVLEKEGNNTPEAANAVTLPALISGIIQSGEDVDVYKFTAAAGEEVAFSCISSRLQDKIHDLTPGGGGAHSDPILVITDEGGRELATADDYYGPDPVFSHKFEKAGTYSVQIRDVRYQGMAGWTYCLTATQKPFLVNLFPMAGERGKPVEVQPVGFNLGAMQGSKVDVPMMDPGAMDVQLKAGAEMTNPVPFIVSDAPQVVEAGENDTFEKGTPAILPAGLNGRIEKENDVDLFRFKGTKGQTYTFEVYARRYGSSLDSFIQIVDSAGKPVTNNDDALGKDSRLDWTCPSDAEFALQVGDLHSRGGATYVYHVGARLARPDFELRCDDDKALIGPGSGYSMYVIATRRNGFAGEIKLAVEGLPPGVTAIADRIPANMTQACVVLRAAADAKVDFRRIRMFGTGEIALPDGKKETLRRSITPMQEIYMPGGGRSTFAVDTHVVSVTEPSDVILKLSSNKADLKPGGTATIDVEVVRQKGYDKNVVLDVYLRHLGGKHGDPLPPGVSLDEAASKTLLGPTDTKGKIVLKAAANAAPVDNLPIAVLGQVSINFVVKVSHASEPLYITVTK